LRPFLGVVSGAQLAVVAACQALEAEVVAISSVTASSWGANQAGFTWPRWSAAGARGRDSAGVALCRRARRSRAGSEPTAGRWPNKSSIEQLPTGACAAPAPFSASIEQRSTCARSVAGSRPVVLYVNVGGTEASLGESATVLHLRSGFIPGVPFDFSPSRGLMARFAERGVPVLTLLNVRDLAVRWGVPLAPRTTDRATR
jgi:hypothetical protein